MHWTVDFYCNSLQKHCGMLRNALSDSHLICVDTQALPLDITAYIIVGHADAELNVILHVHHAAVGVVLGVDLAGEDLVGGDGGHHL